MSHVKQNTSTDNTLSEINRLIEGIQAEKQKHTGGTILSSNDSNIRSDIRIDANNLLSELSGGGCGCSEKQMVGGKRKQKSKKSKSKKSKKEKSPSKKKSMSVKVKKTKSRSMSRSLYRADGTKKRPLNEFFKKSLELQAYVKSQLSDEKLNNVGVMSKMMADMLKEYDRDVSKCKKNFDPKTFMKKYNVAKKESDEKRAQKKASKSA